MKKVLTMLLFLVCFLFISPQQTEAANLSLNDLFKTPDKVETPTNFVPSLEKFLKNGKQTKGITTYSSIATNILTDVTMTDSKSNAFTDQNRPTLTEEVKINFTWSIPDELNVQAGDTYSFMLPNVFAIYEPINGTLGEYGDFSVGLDGTVVMTFNQNTQDSSDVHGTLDFTTNFNEQKIIGSTTVLITFPIQVAETVVLNFVPSGGSSLTKTGTTDTSYNPKQINWTINANGNQNYLTGLTLSDNVPAGLSIIPNSVSVYYLDVFTNGTNTLGNVVDPSQYTVNISGAGDLTVTFKSPTFQAYQIDYSTTIEDLSQTSFTNSISMSAQSTATVNATSKVSINRAKHINKSSTYTQKNQTIEWAIQYNYDEETIPVDKTDFTDTFSNTHVLQPGSIEVRNVSIDGSGNATIGALVSSDQYVISDASTSSVNGFKLSFNSSVNSAYQIVYETVPVADLLANLVINNKVVSSFGVEEVANASRSIQQGNIMKSVTETDYSQKKISWQQIINNNNYVMDSPFLRDQFTAGGLSLINNSVTIKDTLLGNKLLLQGTDYVFTPDPAGNGFTIQFIGSYQSGMTSTLQLNYDTTFNYAQLISGTNFLNTATLTWSTNGVPKTSSMNASVNPGSYTENNGFKSGSYDAVKRQLNWTVGANYNLYPINQLKISDTWDATHKLIPTSVQVHKMKLSSGQNGYTDGGLVDPNSYSLAITDQSVLVTFNAPTQGAYYIVYSTVSSNSKMLPKYSNTATLSDGGQLQETYNASVTVPNGGVYVDKSAVQSGGYVDWKVAINEGQSTINAAKITDNPSQNQVIVASTVQLYDTTVQSNGSYTQASPLVVNKDYSLNVATDNLTGKQTMTITFANTIIKPYILTYQTFIDANDQDTLSNSVTLSGSNITTENVSTTSNIVVEVSGGTGTGEGEQGLLTIQKSDSVNTSLPLEGVEFQLYDSTGVNLFRTGTTDASGKLQLGGLRFGNYLLKETQAADGYLISSALKSGMPISIDSTQSNLSLTNKLDVGSVILVLADINTKTKFLPGAKFKLVDSNNNVIQTNLITDSQGTIQVDNLKPGNYSFIEISAPAGYARDENTIDFTIVSNSNGPVNVEAFNDISNAEKMKQGNIFVHKLGFPEGATIPSIAGNGEELSQLPPNAQPVPGVEVAVVAVTGNSLGPTPSLVDANNYYQSVKGQANVPQDTGVTDENGVFETKTLPAGQYLVIDVQSEPGTIQTAAPVIVSLPMMLADGTGWNDQVHVYTKNEVLLGAAKVMKTSDNNQPLAGAIFSLYKVNDSGPDQLVMSSLTSHNDGYTDIVGNLVLGDYYFLETRAPSGYLVNQSKSSFSITMSDQAYDTNGNLINSQVKVSSLQNFLQPQINKTLLTNASSDLGATVSWEITADVPTDIAEYTQYIVTDTLDSQLSYKGNLVVSADGVQVNPTNYLATVNNGQLTITFLDSMNEIGETMLLGKKELEITFDTVINSTAIPGAAIPNTAVLTMNNGYVSATSRVASPPNVQTGGRQFVKQNPSNQALAGAEFLIYKTVSNTQMFLIRNQDKTVSWTEDSGSATTFVSASDGTFELYGLAYGTYYLEETKAPQGYNLLSGPKSFVINQGSYGTAGQILIINSSSPSIPITGGIGTMLYFIIGLCLMGGSYYFYRTRYSQA